MPLAEAAERDGLRLHVLADERSAGFFALGLALASGMPAIVVTTSGTAAAELHPAVVEAHHAGVPMLAVTADRPPELHDFGAPQTVHQVGLFGSSVRWEVDPGPPDLGAVVVLAVPGVPFGTRSAGSDRPARAGPPQPGLQGTICSVRPPRSSGRAGWGGGEGR